MKKFTVTQLLNCTTQRLIASIRDVLDIIDILTGNPVPIYFISMYADEMQEELFKQLPQLKEPSEEFEKWRAEQEVICKGQKPTSIEIDAKIQELIEKYSLKEEYIISPMNNMPKK